MEAKQYPAEKPTNHRRNQKRNQNMHRNKLKHNKPKPTGPCKSSTKGKVHSNTGLPQETRKKSNK